jgi:hypothetical protein
MGFNVNYFSGFNYLLASGHNILYIYPFNFQKNSLGNE